MAESADDGGVPQASRPRLPKAFGVPASLEGTLPWRWAEERLEQCKTYWVCTVRPDGRPHAVPVWGLWVGRRFYFGGGGRKAKNLAGNPNVVVHLDQGAEVVIVEGSATCTVPAPDVLVRLRDASLAKYAVWTEPSAGSTEPTYVVVPRVVLAWQHLPADSTRWEFTAPDS